MAEAVVKLEAGALDCNAQATDAVTYAKKIDKAEAKVDFDRAAQDVRNHIHGLSPFPGAWFEAPSEKGPVRVKALLSRVEDGEGTPGTTLDDALLIACGDGAVRLLKAQREGKGAQGTADFVRGFPLAPGARLA